MLYAGLVCIYHPSNHTETASMPQAFPYDSMKEWIQKYCFTILASDHPFRQLMNTTVCLNRGALRTSEVRFWPVSFPSPLVATTPGSLRGQILLLCAGLPVYNFPQQTHHPAKIIVVGGNASECWPLPLLSQLVLITFSVWHPDDQRKRLPPTFTSQRSQKRDFTRKNNWVHNKNT